MKHDSIGSLAEIMPYYGTFDQVWKIMRMMSLKSKKIFDGWNVQLGKIIKRKKIKIDFNNFLKILNNEDEDLLRKIKLFEIDLIRLKTIEDYRDFNKSISTSVVKDSIKINRLQLPLRELDNFDMSYREAWIISDYT